MNQFSTEQKQQARVTNLYDFLIRHHADRFNKIGDSLRYKANRSISIKQGYCGYYDFATGEKGNSIDFLVSHLGYRIDEAVHALIGEDTALPVLAPTENHKSTTPVFPESTKSAYKQLFAYLSSRGISNETIEALRKQHLLYQDEHNNIVFANIDRDWGERRGTNTYLENICEYSDSCIDYRPALHGWCADMHNCTRHQKKIYRGMIENSRPDGYWWFSFNQGDCDKAYICESSIDAISLYEIHRLNNSMENAVYASIGGVSKQQAIDSIANQYRAILAVDNDEAGEKCRARNPELDFIVPIKKDWNDDLLELLSK